MGEARRRGLVLAGRLPRQHTEAELSWFRRKAAMLLKAEVEAQVALEIERAPERQPEALPGDAGPIVARHLDEAVALEAQREQVQSKVAGYRQRRLREMAADLLQRSDAQQEICRASGCAINVHAPGCNLYTVQMAESNEAE